MSILEAVQFATLCHASFPATLFAFTLCDIAKDCTECKLLLSICSRKWSYPLPLENCSHCWLQLNIKCALKSFHFHEVLMSETLPTYGLSNTERISSFYLQKHCFCLKIQNWNVSAKPKIQSLFLLYFEVELNSKW